MKNLTSKIPHMLLASALFFSFEASCNIFKEISLEKKVQLSDLVIIGTVESVSNNNCMELNSCADINVVEILKGNTNGKIRVLFGGEVSERDPLCCKVGANYLFFIKRVGDYYQTVNGPYGIYVLP